MGSYRTRLDIIADILSVVSNDAKKTQIMYQANLSYKLLTRYLAEIIKSSLVSYDRKSRLYILTAKGQDFLEKYKRYSRSNRHLERQRNDLDSKRKVLEELCSTSHA